MIDNAIKYIFIYKMSTTEGYTHPESQLLYVTLTLFQYMYDTKGFLKTMGECPVHLILKRRADYLHY